jgi:hypothetical protein
LKNTIQNINFFLASTGLLLFFSSSIVAVYWLDDFWKYNEVAEKGILETIRFFYLNWDGRALSPFFTLRNLIIWFVPYQKAYLSILPSLATLAFTALFIFKLFSLDSDQIEKPEKFTLVSLLTFGLWMGFAAHMTTTLYWATGTYYVYVNFLSVFTIYTLIRRPKVTMQNAFLLIALSLSGVNFALMLIFFLLTNQKLQLVSIQRPQFWIYLTVLLISFFIVVAAPGNYVRAAGKIDFSVLSVVQNYSTVLGDFLVRSRWILGLPAFFAFLLPSKSLDTGKLAFIFLVLALIYLIPFAAFPGSASIRTAISFQTMLFIGLYFFFAYLLSRLNARIPRPILQAVTCLIFAYFHWVIGRQVVLGLEVKKQVDYRYAYLEIQRGGNQRIYLDKLEVDGSNYINTVFDLSADQDYPLNRSTAKFFSVKELAVR